VPAGGVFVDVLEADRGLSRSADESPEFVIEEAEL
jgi:hypothetical protein